MLHPVLQTEMNGATALCHFSETYYLTTPKLPSPTTPYSGSFIWNRLTGALGQLRGLRSQ